MDEIVFKNLLYRGESETLDFKVDQYSFSGLGTTDDEKSELLKDILAFANAWRETDAFILIGVHHAQSMIASSLGITKHLDDAALHQFVDSKTQRPVKLSYEVFRADGKEFGIIKIPVQNKPLFLKADYGKLKANVVYIRRGSSTGRATPDEIAEMGKRSVATATFKVHTTVKLLMPSPPKGTFKLYASLFNGGKATAYETMVVLKEQPNPGSLHFENSIWTWKRGAPQPTLLCSHPIHPGMEQTLADWELGIATVAIEDVINVPYGKTADPQSLAVRYDGKSISMLIRIFARDQPEIRGLVEYSIQEIEAKAGKSFPCFGV